MVRPARQRAIGRSGALAHGPVPSHGRRSLARLLRALAPAPFAVWVRAVIGQDTIHRVRDQTDLLALVRETTKLEKTGRKNPRDQKAFALGQEAHGRQACRGREYRNHVPDPRPQA